MTSTRLMQPFVDGPRLPPQYFETFWGMLAMGCTALVGYLFGVPRLNCIRMSDRAAAVARHDRLWTFWGYRVGHIILLAAGISVNLLRFVESFRLLLGFDLDWTCDFSCTCVISRLVT